MMTLTDVLGIVFACAAGTTTLFRSGLMGFKDRGFLGAPMPVRITLTALGLALWWRAGNMWGGVSISTAQYPNGIHVTLTEAVVHGALALSSGILLVYYFSTTWRRHFEGRDAGVSSIDEPPIKTIPEQTVEAVREALPEALDHANARLLDRLQSDPAAAPPYKLPGEAP